jgi:hypothetical protein
VLTIRTAVAVPSADYLQPYSLLYPLLHAGFHGTKSCTNTGLITEERIDRQGERDEHPDKAVTEMRAPGEK